MIASLQRLLDEAVARGSVRNVVSAFVETLAVWRDIAVYGYVAGAADDSFCLYRPWAPTTPRCRPELDAAAVPADRAMARLSSAETERLGFGSVAGDMLIRRISTDSGASWLMVFAATIDSRDERRLTVYSDLLRESLNDLTAETTDRVVAAIMGHLSHTSEAVEATAQLARRGHRRGRRHSRRARRLSAGATQALAVGNTDLLTASEEGPPNRLVVQAAHDGDSIRLAVAGEDGHFTAHDWIVLEAAVALLEPWARAALRQSDQDDDGGVPP